MKRATAGSRAPRALLLSTCALAAVLGCRGQTSTEPPIVVLRNMFDQDRYDPQAYSDFFADGRTMRTPVEGTIPREREIDPEVGQGRLADDSGYVDYIPERFVAQQGGLPALMARGQERYGIYCAPCHDGTGNGQGMVITRAKWQPPPPSFHQDRLRQAPDGQLFATISHGVRLMPSYDRIPVADRWAIVSYVRALQLSQAGEGQ
jgi:mono/diheme cytochrome c family protein